MVRTAAIAAAILVAIGASGGLLMAKPAPTPTRVASSDTFVPTCKAGQVIQARAEPAWVAASFAGDSCIAPVMPVPVNGYSASAKQIMAAMAARQTYDAAAKAYQRCIHGFVGGRSRADGGGARPLAATLVMIENHRLVANQTARKIVAERTDLAINQFNEYGSECPE